MLAKHIDIADLLDSRLMPDGLAVVLEADHYCIGGASKTMTRAW